VSVTQLERLDAVVQAASEAVARSDRVAQIDVGWANLMTENECDVRRQEAEDRALANARSQAETATQGFDVVIGDIVSVDDANPAPWSCSVYAATTVKEFDRLPIRVYAANEALEEVFIADLNVTFEVHSP
jgi:uncharacterized protein YggE